MFVQTHHRHVGHTAGTIVVHMSDKCRGRLVVKIPPARSLVVQAHLLTHQQHYKQWAVMHWTCARNTWCEHAPLPLPLPRLTECHSYLLTTSEPPTHAAPLHPLLSPTSLLPPGCRGALGGGRTLSSWSSVGHVGGSQRPHLCSRGVCGLPSKYSWLALSCLVYIPVRRRNI